MFSAQTRRHAQRPQAVQHSGGHQGGAADQALRLRSVEAAGERVGGPHPGGGNAVVQGAGSADGGDGVLERRRHVVGGVYYGGVGVGARAFSRSIGDSSVGMHTTGYGGAAPAPSQAYCGRLC